MANNRARYKAMETHYKVLWSGNKCYYCGDKAETFDHIPALSVTYSRGIDALNRHKVRCWKVRCCTECNSIAGDKPHLFPQTRAEYLYSKYLKRYRKVLEGHHWEEDELDELGYSLKCYILAHDNIQEWMERRMEYMEEMFLND